MRRASFRHVGNIARIVVGRATNAARIQDRWAVGQLDEVLLMAMPTQSMRACTSPNRSRIMARPGFAVSGHSQPATARLTH